MLTWQGSRDVTDHTRDPSLAPAVCQWLQVAVSLGEEASQRVPCEPCHAMPHHDVHLGGIMMGNEKTLWWTMGRHYDGQLGDTMMGN